MTVSGVDYEHLENLLREARKHLPESGLRDRVDSAITDQEMSCPKCGHAWWNHNADGPCAVRATFPDACSCMGDIGRRDAILRTTRAVLAQLVAYRLRLIDALILWIAFIVGIVVIR